ncbi:hypothetical protein [Streptomyces sp. NPDC051561]|uniref:hypothetical protein n=1 Tax=Streptomyces sp. NPDC051561 TaxID=3365658 RepID=UPI0037A1AB35
MADETQMVSAPIPVGVRAIPGGSQLDLAGFAQAVVEDVVDALLADDGLLLDDLIAISDPEQSRVGMQVERLVATLSERASKCTSLYGERGLELAERLGVSAARALPVGHWSGEAVQVWQSRRAAAEAVKGGAAA